MAGHDDKSQSGRIFFEFTQVGQQMRNSRHRFAAQEFPRVEDAVKHGESGVPPAVKSRTECGRLLERHMRLGDFRLHRVGVFPNHAFEQRPVFEPEPRHGLGWKLAAEAGERPGMPQGVRAKAGVVVFIQVPRRWRAGVMQGGERLQYGFKTAFE